MAEKTTDDVRRSITAAVAMGIVLTILGFALFDARIGASVFAGAAIGVTNLVAMRAIIGSLLGAPDDAAPLEDDAAPVEETSDANANANADEAGSVTNDPKGSSSKGAAWGLFALVKMLILFGGIWILLTKELVDPVALVVGYGVLPLGIAMTAVLATLSPPRSRGPRGRS